MNKKLLSLLVLLLVVFYSIPSYAVKVSNPEEHAYHSFVDDTLIGIGDKQKMDDRTRYYPDLPNISGAVYINEVYLKIKFSSSVMPDINRISRVETCQGEQAFLNPKQNFHYAVDGHFLILANNYVDGQYTNQLFDADCWVVDVSGNDDVVTIEMNITYHRDSGVDSKNVPVLQDYYAADGYTSDVDNFTGKSTLAVIPDAFLENEKACEPISSGTEVSFGTDNLVVMVHGWNPDGYKNKYGPGPIDPCVRAVETDPSLEFSWHHIYKNLANDERIKNDWVISRYDWSEDASNGFWSNDDFNIVTANEVRDRAHVHGLKLGKIIGEIQPKRVQLIAHSAGNWAARRAADYLRNKFGDDIEIEMTSLDPYVNDADKVSIDEDLDIESAFEITRQWVDKAENYYAIDFGTDVYVGYTSGFYSGWDENHAIDQGTQGGSEYQDFMDNHSGPIYWYANTVTTATVPHPGFQSSMPYLLSQEKPRIEATWPIDNGNVQAQEVFQIYFNKKMDASRLTAITIDVRGSQSGYHAPMGITYDEATNRLMLGHDKPFIVGETVTLSFSDGIRDYSGQHYLNPVQFTFTVADETGEVPGLSVAPNPVYYPNVKVGKSATKLVTVKNISNTAITVQGLMLSGSDAGAFDVVNHQDGCTNTTLQVDAYCQIAIDFIPPRQAAYEANLVVNSTDVNVPAKTVKLAGKGLDADAPTDFVKIFKPYTVTRPDGSQYTVSTFSQSGSINGNVKLEGGTLDLDGQTLTIYGDFIQSGGTLNVNGGKLHVTGDYRIQTPAADGKYTISSGILQMTKESDWVRVGGAFVMDTYGYGYYNSAPHKQLAAGTLEVKGDFSQIHGTGNWNYEKNFYAQGTHRVLLSGSAPQKVSFTSPGRDYSHFNILETTNSSVTGVEFATRAVVTGQLAATSTPIVQSNNLTLSGTALITQGDWNYDLSIDNYSGDWALQQNQTVKKNLYMSSSTLDLNGKTLTVGGSLIQSGGMLNVNSGKLYVTGDYRIQTPAADGKYTISSGILQMTKESDWVRVGGAFVMDTYGYGYYNSAPHKQLAAGTLEVKGDFSQIHGTGNWNYEKNFYAQGTHRVLLSGSAPQKVSFTSPGRDYSHFNILEIRNSKGVIFLTPVVVALLFDHHNNSFELKYPEQSNFPDFDGDGLKDNVDDDPTGNLPPDSAKFYSLTPNVVAPNIPTLFTVSGIGLPASATASIEGEASTCAQIYHSSTELHFRCTASTVGNKRFTLKTAANGNVISGAENLFIEVQESTAEQQLVNRHIDYLQNDSVIPKMELFYHLSQPLSRSDAVVLLDRTLITTVPAFDKDMAAYINPFGDVDQTADYYPSLMRMAYFKGSNDELTPVTRDNSLFLPIKHMTRKEFVKVALQGFNLPISLTDNLGGFQDAAQIEGDWSEPYFSTAVALGVIKGNVQADGTKFLFANNKITVYEALLVLGRIREVLDGKYLHAVSGFDVPESFSRVAQLRNQIGVSYVPDQQLDGVIPVELTGVTFTMAADIQAHCPAADNGKAVVLTAAINLDPNHLDTASPYFWWRTEQGYFGYYLTSNADSAADKAAAASYQKMCFYPATQKPEAYRVTVNVGDNLGTTDSHEKLWSANDLPFSYDGKDEAEASTETTPLHIQTNADLLVGKPFVIDFSETIISKGGLSVGIEHIVVTATDGTVDKVLFTGKPESGKASFVVPVVPEFYGKQLTLNVVAHTQDVSLSASKTLEYAAIYVLHGQVYNASDAAGQKATAVLVGDQRVALDADGHFEFEAKAAAKWETTLVSVEGSNPANHFEPQTIHFSTVFPEQTLTFVGTPLAPSLDVDATVVFDDLEQGTASVQKSIQLTNTGNANLVISGISYAGANVFTANGPPCIKTLAEGESCTFNITFNPLAVGTQQGIVQIQSNALGQPVTEVKLYANVLEVACAQVITHAYNPLTGEEKDYATPCDVSTGWIIGKAPDNDGDGQNDIIDSDDDNDGLSDTDEVTKGTNPLKADTDGDSVNDKDDACPLDVSESLDTDKDNLGNNADPDDDNDGMPDVWETQYGLNPLDASDASQDKDGDTLSNLDEYKKGTDPTKKDDLQPVVADLAVTLTNPSTITPDTLTKHTITVTNNGKAAAEAVVLNVDSPADEDSTGKSRTQPVALNLTQGTANCPLSHADSASISCISFPPTKTDTFNLGTIPAGQTATVEVTNRYSGYSAGNMLNMSANATTSTAETITTNNTSAQAFTLQAKRLVQGCDYRNMANVSPYPQTGSRIANHLHALTFASKDTSPITLFGYSDTGEQAILNGDGFQWSGILQNGTYPSNIWAVAKADTGTRHVGVSLLGGLFWSDDRIIWTPVTAFQGNALNDIAYAKGRYVAVGAQGTILTSVDGINWQQATSGTTAKLAYVDTGNNEFVVGGQGIILSSTDGLVWTTRATNTGQDASALEHGAVWNGSQYLLFDSAGNSHLMAANLSSLTTTVAIKPTVDGVTEVATARTWSAIYWQDNQYIALTTQGLLTSSDGRAWTTQQAIAYPYTYQRLADKAVIAGAHGSIWAAACAPVSVTPPPTLNYFVEQKDVSPATLLESNTLTVSGLAGATTLTITGGEYRKNGAAYTKAKGTVQNGDTLQVRHTTSSKSTTAVTTTLKLGKVALAFKSTTQVIDSVPDAFSFNSQTDVPSLTWMESNVVTVSGVNAPIAISISGGEYRINNGSYTKAKGTVRNGDTLQVRHASSTKSKTTVTTTLKLGTQSFTFKSTTLVIDSVPDAFSFNALTGVARNVWQESASVTVSGINAPLAISISGGEYSINKGTYTKAKGMVKAGDTLQVRHLSAKSAKKSVTTTLTLGKSKVVFKSTTQ